MKTPITGQGPIADQLDDGTYSLTATFNQEEPDATGKPRHTCTVRLEGPSDKRTGLQYRRDIWIAEGSPEIHFRAVMTNASDHPIRWSMQSVSQYDTADESNLATYNKNFWAFIPVNPHSGYFSPSFRCATASRTILPSALRTTCSACTGCRCKMKSGSIPPQAR